MTRPARDPGSLNELQRRIAAAAKTRGQTSRRVHSTVANVALCQMLPEAAVKGGTGLKLRFGDVMTRETPDVDTALRGDVEAFVTTLSGNLATGWGGFTGTVTKGVPRAPASVPAAYVMQPLTIGLDFHRRRLSKIDLEIGYDELNATAEEVELRLAPGISALFAELGLIAPAPVPVLPAHHQMAQKLHACTAPGNERAHDLVDLQLLAPHADRALVAATTRRTFQFRQAHLWPAIVTVGPAWLELYAEAAVGLDVAPDVHEAARWANGYIATLAAL